MDIETDTIIVSGVSFLYSVCISAQEMKGQMQDAKRLDAENVTLRVDRDSFSVKMAAGQVSGGATYRASHARSQPGAPVRHKVAIQCSDDPDPPPASRSFRARFMANVFNEVHSDTLLIRLSPGPDVTLMSVTSSVPDVGELVVYVASLEDPE